MITIKNNVQNELILLTLEDIVPQDSLLRKIDKYIDFTFINEKVKPLYSENNGRPSIEPVVLFKIVFIQYLYGIKSMRETCKRIKTDAEYRWFLNIPFGQETPHFSTFSKNYERRFKNSKIFEEIFQEIVEYALKYKLVDGSTVFSDSTHKKANANKNRFEIEVKEVVKQRREWLEEEINEERRKYNKKEFIYEDKSEKKEIKVSKSDKEAGYYHRDHKEQGFMYLDHRTTDKKCNIILDCYVTAGNVHDSKPYLSRLEHIEKTFGFKIEKVALDSGYDSIDIKRGLKEKEIFGVIGYRRHGSKKSRKKKRQYEYDSERDIYLNKETGEVLEYKGKIDRLGYKKYENEARDQIILRHIKEELNEEYRENRISKKGKELYKQRKETVERSFADSKQNHGFRYSMYKGLEKNQNYTYLSCAAQNMKNIINKLERVVKESLFNKKELILIYFFKIHLKSKKETPNAYKTRGFVYSLKNMSKTYFQTVDKVT